MTEPHAVAVEFWGKAPSEDLAWAWVRERLEAAECYWLVTVSGDGRPAARPVWGVWLDDELLLSVGSTTHWANLRTNTAVTVHLGDAVDVVVLDGAVRVERDPALLSRMCEVYNPKYSWSFTPETTGPIVAVEPRRVTAWRTVPAAESSPTMVFPGAAGRWTFPKRG